MRSRKRPTTNHGIFCKHNLLVTCAKRCDAWQSKCNRHIKCHRQQFYGCMPHYVSCNTVPSSRFPLCLSEWKADSKVHISKVQSIECFSAIKGPNRMPEHSSTRQCLCIQNKTTLFFKQFMSRVTAQQIKTLRGSVGEKAKMRWI